jgi:hypothetical protein
VASFNHIQHDWLQKMVAHRIADPLILRLIGKWLNAGFMMGGVVTRTEEKSPQGGPISPILSNIYLHFVLDLWFEKKIRPACQGEAYLTRFADDFEANFQYRRDAEEFQKTGQKPDTLTSWVLSTYVARIKVASLPWYGFHVLKAAESSWLSPKSGSESIGMRRRRISRSN